MKIKNILLVTLAIVPILISLFSRKSNIEVLKEAAEDVEDWIIKKKAGTFKLLKVLLLSADGNNVSAGCLVQTDGSYEYYPDPKGISFPLISLPSHILDLFSKTSTMEDGCKLIELPRNL